MLIYMGWTINCGIAKCIDKYIQKYIHIESCCFAPIKNVDPFSSIAKKEFRSVYMAVHNMA